MMKRNENADKISMEKARGAAQQAVWNGRLKKPISCEICGDQESRIVAHHWSYLQEHRLDVLWVCDDCHADTSSNSKLSAYDEAKWTTQLIENERQAHMEKEADMTGQESEGGADAAYERGEDDSDFREWLKAAQEGDAGAQNSVAIAYAGGLGVDVDLSEAMKWWRKAAQQDNVDALFALGNMCVEDSGTAQDRCEALSCWRRAGELGHPGAQNNLGLAYMRGEGVGVDALQAYGWFDRAVHGYQKLIDAGHGVQRLRRDAVRNRMLARLMHVLKSFQIFLASVGLGRFRMLHKAVASGDLDSAKRLIALGVDVNAHAGTGATLLVEAAVRGLSTVAELLIVNGANVDGKGSGSYDATPMYAAAQGGHVTVIELLLEKGADVNATAGDGSSAIAAAAGGGHTTTVEKLIACGGDVHTTTAQGATALHLAAKYGNSETAELLITRGADLDALTRDGETPLILAAEHGHHSVAQVLIDSGANINAKDEYGTTALEIAIRNDHQCLVNLLRRYGAEERR